MSENTILYALYALGYRGRMCGHGFRSLASTIFNEAGFNNDWIELQLRTRKRTRAAGRTTMPSGSINAAA